MKQPTRLFQLFVVILLVVTITACGAPTATEPESVEDAESAITPTEEPISEGEATTTEEAPTEEPTQVEETESTDEAGSDMQGCGHDLVIATNGDSQAVNPLFGNDTGTVWRTDQIFEPLVYLDWETLEPIPWLAESWEISEDGTTYTFHLREGPEWPDGTPLTAQDFEFTLLTILSPEYTGPWQGLFLDLVGASDVIAGDAEELEGVEVIDDKTLQLTLNQPNAPFLTVAGRNLKPIPKHLLEGEELTAEHPFMQDPVGVGPYRFVEWVQGDHLTLEAKEDYWGESVCAKRITDRYITDMNALALALESGEVDQIAPVSPRDLARMEEDEDITVHNPPASRMDAIYFNFENEYLANPEVRQAIARVVDQGEFAESILGGIQNPVFGFVMPASWAYDETATVPEQNIEEAEALVEEVGLPSDFSITIMTNAGNTTREQTATYLQSQLEKVGISAEVELKEWSTFITEVTEGQFEVIVLSADAGIPDPDTLYADYHSEGARNYGNYSNAEVDALLEDARATTDTAERNELYQQVQEILADELPRIPVYEYLSSFATQSNIENVKPSVLGSTWDAKYWQKK